MRMFLIVSVVALFSLFLAAPIIAAAISGDDSVNQDKEVEPSRKDSFYELVGKDFFAGLSGDRVAFERAMALCEKKLAEDPKHAEAKLWQGAGDLYLSGLAFQEGNVEKGIGFWQRGLKKMDDAVALKPACPGVLIGRGMALVNCAEFEPRPDSSKAMLQKGVGDLEKSLEILGRTFNEGPILERGEILTALAEGLGRLGRAADAQSYYERIAKELAGTSYARTARACLEKAAKNNDTSSPGKAK
ncbi:MAG TPA: hypothetical protein HPP83_04570 [Candidatus Hydrogenedentes bacterium]|nr:hypothetical protein [Candidatus Hydrogenedentota bacterium]